MIFALYLSLFFMLLRAASEVALVVLAYAALKFLALYKTNYVIPTKPSLLARLRRALKAF
jgi:hypothetical protein